jgi:hypothetical protein
MRLSLQPSPASETSALSRIRALQDQGGGVLAFADQGFERPSFFCAQTDDVFFDRSL